MNTFRIDVGEFYYLLLDAPTRQKAIAWSRRNIPEPANIITTRIATRDEKLDYIVSGFKVQDYTESMFES